MKGYRFDIACGRCGSVNLEHVNGVNRAASESVAVCRCVDCNSSWSVTCLLRPLVDTSAKYQKREQRARERVSA